MSEKKNFKSDIVSTQKTIITSFNNKLAYIIGKIIISIYNELIFFPTLSCFLIDQDNTLGITTSNILNILKHIPIQYLFSDYLKNLTIINCIDDNNVKSICDIPNKKYCGIYYDIVEDEHEKIYTLNDIQCFVFDEDNIKYIKNPTYANKHFVCKTRNIKKKARSKSILFSSNTIVSDKIKHQLINKYNYTLESFNFAYENGNILSTNYGDQYTHMFNIFGLKKENGSYTITIQINLFNDIDDNVYYNYLLYILDIITDIFNKRVTNISYETKNYEHERNKYGKNPDINYEILEINNAIDIPILSGISELNNGPSTITNKLLKPKDIEYDNTTIVSLFSSIMNELKNSIKINIK